MARDTIFDLASLTKVMATATALLLLAEEGAVGLDDPVAKHLPAFAEREKEGVTVRHLLTHSSGLRPWRGFHEPLLERERKKGERILGDARGEGVGAAEHLPLGAGARAGHGGRLRRPRLHHPRRAGRGGGAPAPRALLRGARVPAPRPRADGLRADRRGRAAAPRGAAPALRRDRELPLARAHRVGRGARPERLGDGRRRRARGPLRARRRRDALRRGVARRLARPPLAAPGRGRAPLRRAPEPARGLRLGARLGHADAGRLARQASTSRRPRSGTSASPAPRSGSTSSARRSS